MKKSRKLAWVVLGVVVLGSVALSVQLSCLYSPWRYVLPAGGGEWLEANTRVYDGRPGPFPGWIVRHQRYPWLPGPDRQARKVTEEEYTELHRATAVK